MAPSPQGTLVQPSGDTGRPTVSARHGGIRDSPGRALRAPAVFTARAQSRVLTNVCPRGPAWGRAVPRLSSLPGSDTSALGGGF